LSLVVLRRLVYELNPEPRLGRRVILLSQTIALRSSHIDEPLDVIFIVVLP
jgi:hypothetical protein